MSAFSRGCLLRHQSALNTFRASPFLLKSFRPQSFTTTTLLRAVQKSKPRAAQAHKNVSFSNTKAAPTPIRQTSITPPSTTYQSYATTLSHKPHATLLYTAPSHRTFMLTSYGTALFCFTYAGFSYYSNTLKAPADLAKWVPIAFTGISMMMAGFGCWLVLGPAHIIHKISAIPRSVSIIGKPAGNDELLIEIVLKKMLPVPFMPPRTIYCKPSELTFPFSLGPAPGSVRKPEDLRAMRLEQERAKKQQAEYDQTHFLSRPLRRMSMVFFAVFKSMARTWSREGFMSVVVDGKKYKLDILGGWALDGGRSLDRLATLKPEIP